VGAACLALPAAAQAAAPVSQIPSYFHITGPPQGTGGVYSFPCFTNPDGTITVAYSVSADSRFAFTEAGTMTLSAPLYENPLGPPGGGLVASAILSLDATFTVTAGSTTITGTKTPLPDAPTVATTDSFGICPFGDFPFTEAYARYDAVIQSPSGTTTESGVSGMSNQFSGQQFRSGFTPSTVAKNIDVSPATNSSFDLGDDQTLTAHVTGNWGTRSRERRRFSATSSIGPASASTRGSTRRDRHA
jgi:hypothetical protein